MKKMILALALPLTLAGCISNPSNVEISNADYGDRPDASLYEAKVKSFQSARLKDPDSAIYHFGKPYKAWCKFDGKVNFGWIVDYSLNAKNSYGGYTGAKQEFTFIKNTTAYHMHRYLKSNCGE